MLRKFNVCTLVYETMTHILYLINNLNNEEEKINKLAASLILINMYAAHERIASVKCTWLSQCLCESISCDKKI